MDIRPTLNPDANESLYRQLASYIAGLIRRGELAPGDRLPPTRELAGQIGLNRTTVSAAYELLEYDGLIKGEVGRGSYVCGQPMPRSEKAGGLDWSRALTPSFSAQVGRAAKDVISFTSSRPSEKLFPVDEFRASCREVLESRQMKTLMQLGSPGGYEPLRRYLLERAVESGYARETDDILITNGCQQALDLLRRALVRPGDKVAVEDPVYPGLKNLFAESGAELIGMAVGADGIDVSSLRRALETGARVVVLTPSFQNPTGATIPASKRAAICATVRSAGAVLIENDIYSELAIANSGAPRLKQIEPNAILLGSFSKMAFPGIRAGWIVAPRPVIVRTTELKQLADLHTDHLSQAFLLRFAESGRLAKHCERTLAAAKENLRALDQSCRRHLAGCRWNVPCGGMNMWIDLPPSIDAVALRPFAQQAGIDYLPGRYFAVSRSHDCGLRLSFAGLEANEIRRGIEILGCVVRSAVEARNERELQPALAVV